MGNHRIYTMSFASVYPLYIAKAEKKARTKAEVDEIICWLTGYTKSQLESQVKKQTNFEDFFAEDHKKTTLATVATLGGIATWVSIRKIRRSK